MAKPNFFIVGAPKSGTTALYEYLNTHPDVYFPNKGVYYFCYDLTFRTPPIPESTYLNYYKSTGSRKAIGDGAVFNLLSPGAAVKIKAFNPEAKIIIMLRNPVQMVYSLHRENLANGDENMEDFESTLNAEAARRNGQQVPPHHNCPREGLYYSSVAKYYEQVQRYKSVFANDKMHIIFYDDFKSDTRLEYLKVLKFLELEEVLPGSFKVVNPSKVPRSRTFLNFLLNPPGLVKSTGRFLFPHHSKRRHWLMDQFWNLNVKTKPRPPLSIELKQRLLDMYRDDIIKLSNLLNRDLSAWLKIENG